MPSTLLVTLLTGAAAVHPDIWVQPVQPETISSEVFDLPWVQSESEVVRQPPLVHLHNGPDDPNAVIQAAMTAQRLLIRVVVFDKYHVNDQTGDAIWDDDAVQISIDPRGDAKRLPRQSATTAQPGSLAATFALTRHGLRGWAHRREYPEMPGPLATTSRIERDAGRGMTTYDIVVPWQTLRTVPGESDTLGLQVEINDRDSRGTLRRAAFGDSPPGTFDAKRFKTLRPGPPPQDMLALAPGRLHVWRKADAACAMVIGNVGASLQAETTFGDTQRTVSWQGSSSANKTLRRWQVCVAPKRLLEAPVSWSVTVRAEQPALAARGNWVVNSPGVAVAADLAAIAAMADEAQKPLARRHLQATRALLQAFWATAGATVDDGDAAALEAALAIAQARSRLPPDPEALERSLQSGERPLLSAFVSSEDSTLQPYMLTLPRVIATGERQPVAVFLHGKGAPGAGSFVADAQKSHDPPQDRAYVLAPWGRGNIGWRGFAETDVIDALEHADSIFHFDRDRMWLGGFSQGGTGAWRVAVHHPDRWAAVAIFAGALEGVPMGVGFGANLGHLPVYLHHGLADGAVAVSGTAAMQDELEKNGVKPEVVLEPGGGHVMTQQHQRELGAWMQQHTRTPPDRIRYASDEAGQTAWGITLRHDPRIATYPRVSAHREGRQLRLDTVGTLGLEVDLNDRAWGFTDLCRVMWNGTQVYEGPPKVVKLGLGK